MAKPPVSNGLWAIVEPLLPKHEPSSGGGRPRRDDHRALTGILFVLKTGIAWEDLPQEMGCGCGFSCAGWASGPKSHDAATTAEVSAATAGRLNVRSLGCTNSNASAPATTAAPISTTPSPRSPQQ